MQIKENDQVCQKKIKNLFNKFVIILLLEKIRKNDEKHWKIAIDLRGML